MIRSYQKAQNILDAAPMFRTPSDLRARYGFTMHQIDSEDRAFIVNVEGAGQFYLMSPSVCDAISSAGPKPDWREEHITGEKFLAGNWPGAFQDRKDRRVLLGITKRGEVIAQVASIDLIKEVHPELKVFVPTAHSLRYGLVFLTRASSPVIPTIASYEP